MIDGMQCVGEIKNGQKVVTITNLCGFVQFFDVICTINCTSESLEKRKRDVCGFMVEVRRFCILKEISLIENYCENEKFIMILATFVLLGFSVISRIDNLIDSDRCIV